MSWHLAAAALLTVGVGAAHSLLGERYVVARLLRRHDLPRLFGSDWFTRRTLRFAWHLTTLAWWGMAGVLLWPDAPLRAVSLAFAASALLTAGLTRGRHLAWVVFAAIAGLAWLGQD